MKRLLTCAGDPKIVVFFCPGCECGHQITTNGCNMEGGARWSWNGSIDKPTFQPSILVFEHKSLDPKFRSQPRCHSYVTDGRIQFLGDSTHKLANQTVELPDWDALGDDNTEKKIFSS